MSTWFVMPTWMYQCLDCVLFGQGDSMPVVHGCNLPVGFSGIKMYMVVSLPICLYWAGGF